SSSPTRCPPSSAALSLQASATALLRWSRRISAAAIHLDASSVLPSLILCSAVRSSEIASGTNTEHLLARSFRFRIDILPPARQPTSYHGPVASIAVDYDRRAGIE